MIKDILDSNETVSAQDREFSVLKEHFPACFSKDGSFDIERFKEYISDKIDVKSEGYELKFLGKNYARLLASIDTTTVIKPDKEHNEKPENKDSENLYITGDNLDGLKHLLKSYAGKIKCIYIDPPYNTGSDGFVYNDRFDFTVEDLVTRLSISETQAQRVLDLTKRGSASHSAWLMFMYPRLQLARDLLSDDGVIFISIDDNEQANLKLICDDVFGEENFLATLIRKAMHTVRNSAEDFNKNTDYVLAYLKSRDVYSADSTLRLRLKTDKTNNYPYDDKDGKGKYKLDPIYARNYAKPYEYTFSNGIVWSAPEGSYPRYSVESLKQLESDGEIVFSKNGNPSAKRYLNKVQVGQPPDALLQTEFVGYNSHGTKELAELLGVDKVFSQPKPSKLIKHLLSLLYSSNGFILDFFSGSSTTADAVMQLNTEDGGNRKFIMVQLPEIIKEDKPAYKAGYRTIDEIGRKRIICAAKKIKEENPDATADLGFKHYVLEEPTGKQLDDIIDFDRNLNEIIVTNNIVEEFGTDTVLTTWLVHDGYGFSPKVKALAFGTYTGFHIDKHLYLIDKGLEHSAIEAIVTKFDTDPEFNPENVVLFGYSFTWTEMESLQTNLKRLNATEKNLRINFDIRY
ncbi:MAG: DNA methylase [Firmicutes bacterium ADurb.Bin099]|nr:MAG: DNA methylase [Firmicutes bacterium ADurb.Bin099]